MPMKSTPVGPVAGGIMGCFLVLALGVYCYRHHIHRNSHQYITNLPENQNRMSHFYEEEPHEPADDVPAGQFKLLESSIRIIQYLNYSQSMVYLY